MEGMIATKPTGLIALTAVACLLTALPASAQQSAQPAPSVQAPQPQSDPASLAGLPIYSSDNTKVGVVKSVDKTTDGGLSMQAEIEGFLGLGTSTVSLSSDKFRQDGKRVVLTQTANQVRGLPDANYQPLDRGR